MNIEHFRMKKTPKNPKIYTCKICDFLSSNKKDFKKHILTRKHQNNVKNPKNDNKKTPKLFFFQLFENHSAIFPVLKILTKKTCR